MIVSPYYSLHNHGSGGGNRTPTNGFGDRRTAIILHRNIHQIEEYSVAVFATQVTTKTSKSILLFGRGCKNRTYNNGIKIRCDTTSPIPN
jgi:hypothetical protein